MEFLSTTDLSWVKAHLPVSAEQREEAEVSFETLSGAGGLNAAMSVINVKIPSHPSYPRRFILKRTTPNGHAQSARLGCPRESFFYQLLADRLRAEGTPLAEVIFSFGDMESGEKVLVMEDLSSYGVQSGYFFGPGSPHNWNVDLAEKTKRAPLAETLTAVTIAKDTLRQVAKLHRIFWEDESLLQYSWLRGAAWVQKKDRESWEASQKTAQGFWTQTRQKIVDGTSGVQWDENLLQCMDASLAKIDWEEYQRESATRPWTLVHGDLHPANAMWVWHDEKHPISEGHGQGRALLLDWEVVGLGSGAQDVAQYFISHMSPALRKQEERGLVEDYYATLTATCHEPTEDAIEEKRREKLRAYSFEQCWRDYVSGGCGRWVWLLCLLSALCPAPMTQYFQDQLAAFMKDHNVTPENIGMPRV